MINTKYLNNKTSNNNNNNFKHLINNKINIIICTIKLLIINITNNIIQIIHLFNTLVILTFYFKIKLQIIKIKIVSKIYLITLIIINKIIIS